MWLDDWARAWNIPAAALVDLRMRMGVTMRDAPTAAGEGSESRMQSLMRLDAARDGVWLTRNNVGCLPNPETGQPVRYGLANESKSQNEVVKSADLIGIRSVLIGPQHVGTVIGQFVSREVKHEGWHWTGSKREVCQLAWADFVVSKGGDAAIDTKWR